MPSKEPKSGHRAPHEEMRRTPRIDVRNRLTAHLVALDRPVAMRDFSQGGFSIESDEPIPAGTHIVRIQEGERWSVTVTAASRHRQSSDLDDGSVRHIVGFEYADQSPDTQQTIRVLFERLAADEP